MNLLKPRRYARRLGAVAALVLALGAVTATPALAHPQLVRSTPAKGQSMPGIIQVTLEFSDKIRMAQVVVKDDQGTAWQSGPAEGTGKTVTQRLREPLPAGTYTAAYRVVGTDGHPIESDDLTFTSAGGAAEPPAPADAGAGAAAAEETGAPAGQEQGDSGSGAVLWIVIVAGLAIGIGIGLVIVFRAKRQATGGE
ncbi:copper resistance protein CopC [Actinomadura darangshiensis]|uniref:Copper resistance protein CopC n=1 Tax=Actinomadura darangshiensis TaxID=705336 RepID=A0A4R5B5P1_9ACTN|nr:copper resistance CopC family protein [Actinomadura darangshiensis]TDD79686.1 copper resistance protein CopC [Actinomadura darangshiensis]